NDGSFPGGTANPLWKPGRTGPALEFDGADDYVSIGDSDELSITGDLTIVAWIYPKAIDGINRYEIVAKRVNDTNREYEFRIDTDSKPHYLDDGVNEAFDSTVSINNWTFVAFTRSGTSLSFYKNGVTDGTGTADGTIGDTVSNIGIGSRADGINFAPFNGLIDDVQIYNRALTSSEVMQLYLDPYCMFETVPIWQMTSVGWLHYIMGKYNPTRIITSPYSKAIGV
ncbi:LamG domain-containing protein, partial [Patescibacteria group bacterium]|nr:LamG domain-containing protein [Patescibacteria group bacterium]